MGATVPPAIGSVKDSIATPIDRLPDLSEEAQLRLRALSITTIEELLGMISAAPKATAEFLPEVDLAQLQADAFPHTARAIMADIDERPDDEEYAMGARPPDDVPVEEVASAATFERYRAAATPDRLEGEPGSGPDLRPCFGPVRNQGNRGTCVAHAAAALLECLRSRALGQSVDHSEQFLYCDCKQNDGSPNTEGTFLKFALPCTVSNGVCLEDTWPYNPNKVAGNEGQGPAPQPAIAEAATYLTARADRLAPRDVPNIRSVLDNGQPVAISVPVYDNWIQSKAVAATGWIPMPLPHSVLRGGHAMCAVGYDWDPSFAGGGFIAVRNSWGTGWAPLSSVEPGYGLIPFLYLANYGWEAFTAVV